MLDGTIVGQYRVKSAYRKWRTVANRPARVVAANRPIDTVSCFGPRYESIVGGDCYDDYWK